VNHYIWVLFSYKEVIKIKKKEEDKPSRVIDPCVYCVMGKKSRKQNQELKLCSSLTDKTVIRHVENLFDATSKCSPGGAPVNPTPEIWEEYEAIMTLINAIEQRQGQSPVPLPPRKSAIPELVKWLKMNGGHFDKIEISEMPETGFGLRVLEAVKEEEMVIRVPNSLILSQSSAMSKELLGLVKSEPVLSAMPNLVLALILLNERYSPNSFWKPYISETLMLSFISCISKK
jgi:histone-lysine N-methyltransferase SETD3